MLVVGKGGRLAGGADRHQPVHPACDLPLDETNERLLVDSAVAEGGHERRKQALEQRLGHDLQFAVKVALIEATFRFGATI
jgi:hypothetical protein